MSKRVLKGKVVSVKMADTVIVAVNRVFAHPKYRKIIRSTKRYKAHCVDKSIKDGDRVLIEESRPISKDKRWVVRALPTS